MQSHNNEINILTPVVFEHGIESDNDGGWGQGNKPATRDERLFSTNPLSQFIYSMKYFSSSLVNQSLIKELNWSHMIRLSAPRESEEEPKIFLLRHFHLSYMPKK